MQLELLESRQLLAGDENTAVEEIWNSMIGELQEAATSIHHKIYMVIKAPSYLGSFAASIFNIINHIQNCNYFFETNSFSNKVCTGSIVIVNPIEIFIQKITAEIWHKSGNPNDPFPPQELSPLSPSIAGLCMHTLSETPFVGGLTILASDYFLS